MSHGYRSKNSGRKLEKKDWNPSCFRDFLINWTCSKGSFVTNTDARCEGRIPISKFPSCKQLESFRKISDLYLGVHPRCSFTWVFVRSTLTCSRVSRENHGRDSTLCTLVSNVKAFFALEWVFVFTNKKSAGPNPQMGKTQSNLMCQILLSA